MSRRRPCLAGPVPGSACRVPSGYGGRHARTVWAGTGEARLPGLRRAKTGWYKPMVKAGGGQRESEGAVVPLIGVQHNAPGGKGPHFDRASGEGKHQGMAGAARPNYPGGPQAVVAGLVPPPAPGEVRANPVKVRELQRRLWAAAKQSPERRFHALYDRVHRGDVLWEAWERVRANRGAAGVDQVTLAYVQEEYGVRADARRNSRVTCARARTVPRPPGAWTSRSQMAGSGRWAFRRSATGWPSRPRRSCWSRCSRRISFRARSGSGRGGRRRRRWNG